MNVSVGARWEEFVNAAVKSGRYGSVSEVVREGLRLVEEREAKLNALREEIQTALQADKWVNDDAIGETIHELDAEFAKRGL